MDLAFIRNQIELKLNEADSLMSLYNSRLKKEFKYLSEVIDDGQKKELKSLLADIETCAENIKDIEEEFQFAISQLTVLHADILKNAKTKIDEIVKSRTSTFESITIVRHPLKYSKFVESIGYDKENSLLDVSFNSGSVHRYYNVPEEYFDDLTRRNNFKGFKTELAKFDSKKIEDLS
jgi:hypothetical protein